MRLTALCVCGTLLAFSSLPWIRAEEGVLLGDRGFGPCAATLKPEGACRQGQHGSTCPYQLSLPPLTVHLPHLRELEDIMQDLQKLKDSVDELRTMCAGCESHSDRRCGRQTEREHVKQTEGKSTHEDVRNWMNVRPETERDFNLECGKDAVKLEKTDTEKRLMLEEEERHKWETDRKGNKGAVKEKEREETLSEVRAKDGKPKRDGARGKDAPDQKRMPTAGGNTRTGDVTSENVFETDHREVDRIKDALKGNLKGFQEDKLENEDGKKILTNVKNKEKTKEESNIHVWQEDINKTKRTEAGDKTKMSENRGDHTNEEQEEQEGETREEMETGIKVGRNNENPKQTESAGRSGKEKTVKEGEVDDKDREIKTESVQRDGDGELSSRKTTERTDFFPISPTPLSITRSTSRLDPSKVTTLTSSLPSPSFPTLSSITDVSHETKGVYGLTKSSSHGAGDTSKTQSTDVTTATGTTTTTTTEQPSTGSWGHKRSTTTTHQTLRITVSPNVTDRSRWTPKKNISSNIRGVVTSPPGPGLKPGQKIKPGIKSEAERNLKNLKNDRKPDQAPIPDKRTKYNQKQKPAPHKPTSEKPKTGRDPKQTQITKPDRRAPPYILVPNKTQKNNLTRQEDLTLRNKLPFHKPKSPQRPPTSVQIPQPVNSTHSDGHPIGNKDLESDKTPDVDQNSKPEKKLIHPLKTNKPDQKKKTEKTLESEEKTKLDDNNEQIPNSAQRTSTRNDTKHLTPKSNQEHQTQSVEITGENPSQEPKSKPDSTAGAEVTPHRVHATFDQMKNISQETAEMKPEFNRELVTSQMNQKPLSESVRKSDKNHSQEPESKPGLKLGQTFISGRVNATSDQINHSSQAIAEIKHKLNPTKAPKGETVSSKPDPKLLGENKSVENTSHVAKSTPDLTPERKITISRGHETSDQMNQSSMETTEIKHKPERIQEPGSKRETATSKPNEKHSADNVETSDGNPIQEPESYQVNATPDRMSESSKRIPDIKVEKETTTSNPNEKPLSVDTSIQSLLLEPTFIPELKPEKIITSDEVNASSGQTNESSQGVIGKQLKPSQELESKRDTTTSQPNHVFSTESVKRSEKYSYKEPESNTDKQSVEKITFDQVNATSNQMNTSKQEIPKIKHKPKLVQKPESKNEAATSKPELKLLTMETSDESSLKEQEFNPDIKSEKRLTFDQVNRTSGQKNKPIQERTDQINKSIQERPDSKNKSIQERPDQINKSIQERTDQINKSIQERHDQMKKSIQERLDQMNKSIQERPDQMNKSIQERPDQINKSIQERLDSKNKSIQERTDQINKLIQERPDQMKKSIQERPDRINKSIQERPDHMNKSIQERPDQMNKSIQERHDSKNKSIQERPDQINKSIQERTDQINKSIQERHDQMKKSIQERHDQMKKSIQERPDQMNKSIQERPDSKNKSIQERPDQINKSIQERTDQTNKSIQERPDQMNKSIQERPDHMKKSIQERPDQINKSIQERPDQINKSTQERSDQVNKSIQGRPTIKYRPKPVPKPESKSKTVKHKQKPLNKFVDGSDQIPPHTPKFNPDLTPGQKITSDPGTVTPDQIKKPRQEIKIKPKPKPSQEPKFKSETASSKPLAEFVDGSEQIPSNEPKKNLDSTPEQKIQSNLFNGTYDQIDKPSQEIKQPLKSTQDPESKGETASSRNDQKTVTTHKLQKVKSNQELTSGQTSASDQNPKHVHNVSSINKIPKPGSEPTLPPKYPKAEAGLKRKPDTDPRTVLTPQTNSSLRTPRPGPKLNLKPLSQYEQTPTPESNRTSKPRPPFQFRPPTRHISKPGPKLIQRPKQPVQPAPSPKTKTVLHPSKTNGLPSENIPNSKADVISPTDLGKQIAEVTHSPRETSSTSTRKTLMLGPKTSNSLTAEHLPRPYTNAEDITLSPNSRTVSDLRPQTASLPSSIPMTTRPNTVYSGTLPRVFTSTNPGPTQQSPVPKSDSLVETKILHYVKETGPETTLLSSLDTTFTPSSDLRSEASTTSDPTPFAAQPSTPSAQELRVKINQVAAFVNNSLNPNGRLGGGLPRERPEGSQSGGLPGRINGRLPTSVSSKVPRDCSDLLLRGKTTSGVYLVTPDLRSRSFPVFCDMVLGGGGWTLLQSRKDGSVSFNRTWVEYQTGFGVLDGGEFWLGNNMIHLLTRDKDMMLRVELEDFDGVTGFAQYELFRVAGERLRYRLTVDGYSGTAGDALRFSKRYDHNNRAFTTPDRDHDRYPSGNCGAYYSSGWWFDACMAANLNGRYYNGKYKGVRDGIFWGTWYNISEEYYPTNERLSFKSVRMMIRPKAFMQ